MGLVAPKQRDFDHLKQEINEAKANIDVYKSTLETIKPDLLNNADHLHEAEVNEAINAYQLNQSGGSGYRKIIGKLSMQGIGTLGQLLSFCRSSEIILPGFSFTESENLRGAAEKLKQSVQRNTKLVIDFEKYGKLSASILQGAHLWDEVAHLDGNLQKISDEKVEPLSKKITDFPVGRIGRVRWLLTRRQTKEKITQQFSQLREEVDHLTFTVADFSALFQESTGNQADLKADFLKNTADYYALFESIGLSGTQNAESSEEQFLKMASGNTMSDNQQETDRGSAVNDALRQIITRINQINPLSSPLKARLRSWQKFGAKYILAQKKVLLGDEMGLGKTVEALAVICKLAVQGKNHAIVVTPMSTLPNWRSEITKHTHLQGTIIHGANRDEQFEQWMVNGGIALTNYETMWRLDSKGVQMADILIVDEAQYVKNPLAKRSKCVYEVAKAAPYAVFMTGTPIENVVDDMVHLIEPLQPEVAKSLPNGIFMTPSEFQSTVAPVYLRRRREQVLGELPALQQSDEKFDFGVDEAKNYRTAVANGNFMAMRRAAWTGKTIQASPKMQRLIAICQEAHATGRKVLIFSFFRSVLQKIQNEIQDIGFPVIMGGVNGNDRQAIIDHFKSSRDRNVLCLQINTAGLGLNLQEASIVIFCEPQIKPSLESQALSRAYRMGQAQKVSVYRLLTENSVDDLMLELLDRKKQTFEDYAQNSTMANSSAEATSAADDHVVKQLEKQLISMEQKRLAV
ncbi:MAG: DEAD/DEAH box helicase [Schleiferilactobacillus perolens]|uniref:DEAD/DEAH box helicase n=1 Tax=Schleiferilactobacillus perolens TaxID=100468 RepID=UPI0039E96B5F